MASFARSLSDGAAAADGIARNVGQARPLGDGAAASDELLPWNVAATAWWVGPLIDTWTIGPLETLAT